MKTWKPSFSINILLIIDVKNLYDLLKPVLLQAADQLPAVNT